MSNVKSLAKYLKEKDIFVSQATQSDLASLLTSWEIKETFDVGCMSLIILNNKDSSLQKIIVTSVTEPAVVVTIS